MTADDEMTTIPEDLHLLLRVFGRDRIALDVLTGLGDVYPSETGSSPAGQEIKLSPNCQDRLWSPSSLLFSAYRVSTFAG